MEQGGGMASLVPDVHMASSISGPSKKNEIIASSLLALPWIALSWYYKHHVDITLSLSPPTDDSSPVSENVHLDRIALRTCALTALTMVIFGCGQMVRSGDSSATIIPKPNASTFKNALLRILSIALPVYAALKAGGYLVAFTLLLAFASGLPTIMQDPATDGQARLSQRKPTLALIGAVILLISLGLSPSLEPNCYMGHIALILSILVIRPPFSGIVADTPGLGVTVTRKMSQPNASNLCALGAISPDESVLITISGLLLGVVTVFLSGSLFFEISQLVQLLLVAGALSLSLTSVAPAHIRSPSKVGLAVSTGGAALLCAPPLQAGVQVAYLFRCTVAVISFFAVRFDDSSMRHAPSHGHHHDHHESDASKLSKLVIRYSEPYPLLYSIVKASDSRRIFYFMVLNFSFMLVQLSYGFITGSLGLLSDSIHMFFDCLALVVGLCAAVMSKWPPSARFPYGYGKVDTLSGFANGIFLMIISIEIIYEAVERLSSGSQMHRLGELLAVSVAGLVVNLIGIMSFEHGHGHGHDHGHGHSHGNENMHGIFLHILADTLGSVAVVISTILVHYSGWAGYDPIASCLIAILIFASAVPLVTSTAKSLLLTLPADIEYNLRDTLAGVSTLRGVAGYTVPKFWLDDTGASSGHDHHHGHDHGHGHGHSHGHSHGDTNDHSHSHSHSHNHSHSHSHSHSHHDHGHDHSHHNHHSHHDHDHDHDHDHEKHNPNVLGVIHVIAARGADLEDVRQRTVDFLREKGMDILVQVEREGDGRCWCGGGNKS
ncbi:putative zinc transporter msc2 [Aspergillus nanangensis]|uniref:Zinc transporter n=1 Tax=Aspergillus nanangensis TaxID=2582783 RepID=A0AAD4CQV3_ASPNN|nr:putative zinc transporter msc2 [Aspergillus nanangensis]